MSKRKAPEAAEHYDCPGCKQAHKFPVQVLEGLALLWSHVCCCGQQNILVNGRPCSVVPPAETVLDS